MGPQREDMGGEKGEESAELKVTGARTMTCRSLQHRTEARMNVAIRMCTHVDKHTCTQKQHIIIPCQMPRS